MNKGNVNKDALRLPLDQMITGDKTLMMNLENYPLKAHVSEKNRKNRKVSRIRGAMTQTRFNARNHSVLPARDDHMSDNSNFDIKDDSQTENVIKVNELTSNY